MLVVWQGLLVGRVARLRTELIPHDTCMELEIEI